LSKKRFKQRSIKLLTTTPISSHLIAILTDLPEFSFSSLREIKNTLRISVCTYAVLLLCSKLIIQDKLSKHELESTNDKLEKHSKF